MLTHELLQAAMQERMREAAELRRQREAEALCGQDASPRGGLSRPRLRLWRLPLPSFVARSFRTASVP